MWSWGIGAANNPINDQMTRSPNDQIQASVSVSVEEPLDEREPHDLEVEPDRPVLDVIQVVLDPLLEGRIAAPAVHLGPPGEAGLHFVPEHVLRNFVLELLDEVRPLRTRADDRHVP